MSAGDGPIDGAKMKPGQALQHVKAAVRTLTIEVSIHAEKDHPERAITVAELLASILAAGSATQQGNSNVWEIRGPADATMVTKTRRRFILSHVAIRRSTVVITCRREP